MAALVLGISIALLLGGAIIWIILAAKKKNTLSIRVFLTWAFAELFFNIAGGFFLRQAWESPVMLLFQLGFNAWLVFYAVNLGRDVNPAPARIMRDIFTVGLAIGAVIIAVLIVSGLDQRWLGIDLVNFNPTIFASQEAKEDAEKLLNRASNLLASRKPNRPSSQAPLLRSPTSPRVLTGLDGNYVVTSGSATVNGKIRIKKGQKVILGPAAVITPDGDDFHLDKVN